MRALALIALAVVLSAGVASARPSADPGVSQREILIGGTVPLSGIAASYASVGRGAEAYFKYVNARGGVNGRRINYKYVDDQYNPSQTVQAVRELVQQDRVFAIFNALGTEHNLAVRSFLNASRVPQLFAGSGATTFGRDHRRYPYTIGYLPSYVGEGKVYARHIRATKPNAKVAVLYQNDDYGRDLLAGLRRGLGAKAKSIVARVGYDPTSADVQPQVTQLKASKANVFMVFAFGKFSLQAFNAVARLNWKPQIFVNDVSSASQLMSIVPQKAATGSISISFGKDPASPTYRRDRGIRLFQSILRQHGDSISTRDLTNGYFTAGMASAHTMVTALRQAGRNLTRQSIMRAVTHLNEKGNPFVLPGIVVRTTPTSRFPITQVKMQRWKNGAWRPFGKLITAKPG